MRSPARSASPFRPRRLAWILFGPFAITASPWANVSALPFDVATIEIHEPLGFRWPDEWVSREVNVARSARVADLHLLGGDDEEIAFEVRSLSDHRAIPPSRGIEAGEQIEVFFRAALSPGETALWRLVSDSERDRAWAAVEIERVENATLVRNGAFELELERNRPAVLDGLRIRRGSKSLLRFRWPEDVHPESVEDLWSAEGPARHRPPDFLVR